MDTLRDRLAKRRRRGFSLLELLVALAVLALIVLMTSLVFQQTSGIWQNATRASGLDMVARGIVAQIQADLEQAVPAANYTNTCKQYITHNFIPTDARPLHFIVLRDSAGSATGREAVSVAYRFDGDRNVVQRCEIPLEFKVSGVDAWWEYTKGSPDSFSPPSSEWKDIAGQSDNAKITELKFDIIDPDNVWTLADDRKWTLPPRVDITAKMHYESINYQTFAGRSFGPDTEPDPSDKKKPDDIYVGGGR